MERRQSDAEDSILSNSSADEDLIAALKEQYPGAVIDIVVPSSSNADTSFLSQPGNNIEDNIIVEDFTDINLNISFISDNFRLESQTLPNENGCESFVELSSNTDSTIHSASNSDNVENKNLNECQVSIGPVSVAACTTNDNEFVPTTNKELRSDLIHNSEIADESCTSSNADDPDYEMPEQESEDEESQEEVTNGNLTNENNLHESVTLGHIKRKRNRIALPEEWRDTKNKKLREQGKKYEGWTKKPGEKGKRGKGRNERKIGPPCSSKGCAKSGMRQCTDINEDERKQLFNTFWGDLSWDQKKIYIGSLVHRSVPSVTRKENPEESRRQNTLTYTLKKPNGQRITVCKKLFLSTFNLGEWTVSTWASGNVEGQSHGMTPSRDTVRSARQKSNPPRKSINPAGTDKLISFIETLPKLPSHYCRQKSNKTYLEPVFGNSWVDVYKQYVTVCTLNPSEPIKPVSRASFDRYILKCNLAFQPVKKDRCDECIMYENKQLNETVYQDHQKNKKRARQEKEEDKKKALEGLCTVLTMDVEAVKVCPSLNASALYYKTKLCCHNFTVYNLANQDTVCYWFDETQADLTSNTFASCLVDFLTEHCDISKPIIVWSDGCTNQNRNSTMANALLAFSHEKQVVIEQKYLVKGHTQMEVDTVHSLIERRLKDKPIYLPSDFQRLTEEARHNPTPLKTKVLKYDFVKNYGLKHSMVYDTVRPGKKPGDPVVTNLKAIKYTTEGKIQIKLDFDENYSDLPQRIRNKCQPLSSFPSLHKERLKISKKKWTHLQELKAVIPTDCHPFYDLIPYDNKE